MLGAIVYNVLEWTWNTENIGSKELNDNPFYTKFNESNVRRQRRRLVRNFVQEVGLMYKCAGREGGITETGQSGRCFRRRKQWGEQGVV